MTLVGYEDFLNMTPKNKEQKKKIKLNFIKFKGSCTLKVTIKRMEITYTMGLDIFKSNI